MSVVQLSPIAVTVQMPDSGILEPGQEVVLTFHAVTDCMRDNLGFALQALGGHLEQNGSGGDLVCRLKLTEAVSRFGPACVRNGVMCPESPPLSTSDGY